MTDFKTIRETAKTGILSEHYLRLLVAQKKAPGIQVGNRFLINYPLLVEQLNVASSQAVKPIE